MSRSLRQDVVSRNVAMELGSLPVSIQFAAFPIKFGFHESLHLLVEFILIHGQRNLGEARVVGVLEGIASRILRVGQITEVKGGTKMLFREDLGVTSVPARHDGRVFVQLGVDSRPSTRRKEE